jgi:O-antigen/teichoic acid export membrane protein
MAITDVKHERQAAAFGFAQRLRRRAADFLSGEHSQTQKMAGMAFAIRVASAGIVFASQALLARWIGSHQFGTYVYLWTCLLLAGDLVHLGLPLTAQRFVPEYRQTHSVDLLRGYLSGSRWIIIAAGTVAALVAALIVYGLPDTMLEADLRLPFYFACAALPVYGLTFMSDGLARSYNWINLALLPAYIVRPLLLIGIVAAMREGGVALNAAVVMGVLACVSWASALLQTFQLNRRLRAVVPAGARHYDARKWLSTGLPILFVWGVYTLLTSTDIVVLKQFRPAEHVAHYYAAAKIVALVSIVYFAVAATSAHRFTAYHVANDRDGLERFAATTVRWVFWLSLAFCLVMLVLGRPLLSLFGADFVAAYPVMLILAVGQLARASIGPAERLLTVLGQQRACAVAYVAAFGVNIGGCLLLTPAYGAIGAATATAAAFGVESVLLFVIAKRGLGLHMFVWDPWRGARARRGMVNQDATKFQRFE